jgi:hypothetical protein
MDIPRPPTPEIKISEPSMRESLIPLSVFCAALYAKNNLEMLVIVLYTYLWFWSLCFAF